MTPYQDIVFEQDGAVAVVKLNRPHVLNAFSGRMGEELADAFQRCDTDESIRVVVLTGEGRAFCAGADFSSGAQVFDAPANAEAFKSDPLTFHAWDIRKPTIAAVNGHAVGLGLTLALQCDIRLVAADAKCGIVQNRRGVFPDFRSHWTLPRTIGFAKALDLMLTGRMFSGEEAAEMGLASRDLPADKVLSAAMALAHDISVNVAPISAGLSKRLLWSATTLSAPEADELERRIHLHVMGAPDAREGPTAWVEQRTPNWQMTFQNDWPDWIDELGRGAAPVTVELGEDELGEDSTLASADSAPAASAPAALSAVVAGSSRLATEIAAALLGAGELSSGGEISPEESVSSAQSFSPATDFTSQLDVPPTLDLLVYVCGCSPNPKPLAEMSEQQWVAECEDVLAEAVECLKVLHAPLKTAGGHVVFVIPSISMSGAKGFSAAAAAGEGLRALAKSTAKQWGTDGIRVNTVALDPRHFVPGEIGEQLAAVMGLATSSGFGHPGDIVGDIVPAIRMLQSDEAHFLTGATLTLDGGVWMAS